MSGCRITNTGVGEVPTRSTGQPLQHPHVAKNMLDERLLGSRGNAAMHPRLEVAVQVLVGIQLRGVGRQIEHLDRLSVRLEPGADHRGVVDLEVVEDQKHLPGGLPVWAGVVLLFLAYKVVVSPIKALRRACYYRNLGWPYYWHPAAELVQGLVTLCFLALFVFLADRFIPGFHQALLAVPGMLQHAAEVVRHWWTQR